MGEVFQRVVEIGRRFGVFTNDHMVELAAGIVLKDGADHKGGGAAMQVLTEDALGLGKT